MKHSIKPYSKYISEVQWAFYKSTKDHLIPAWCIKEKWKPKCKRRSKIAHIAWTKRIWKHTDICWRKRGCHPIIPKLRRLSILEYLLGVPLESPSLSSCLSSFSSYRDLLDLRTLHPHKTSTENSVRSVSIIKQITTLSTVANQFIFFLHCVYCNITFPWLNPLIGIDSFIKTSKLCIKNRICLKQDSL